VVAPIGAMVNVDVVEVPDSTVAGALSEDKLKVGGVIV
jgi:hypothetical protein